MYPSAHGHDGMLSRTIFFCSVAQSDQNAPFVVVPEFLLATVSFQDHCPRDISGSPSGTGLASFL